MTDFSTFEAGYQAALRAAGRGATDVPARFFYDQWVATIPMGSTPRELQALHATNDLISETLLRLRTLQSHVTTALARASWPPPEGDQRVLETLLSRTNTPYEVLPWEDGRADVAVWTTTFRFGPDGLLMGVLGTLGDEK